MLCGRAPTLEGIQDVVARLPTYPRSGVAPCMPAMRRELAPSADRRPGESQMLLAPKKLPDVYFFRRPFAYIGRERKARGKERRTMPLIRERRGGPWRRSSKRERMR